MDHPQLHTQKILDAIEILKKAVYDIEEDKPVVVKLKLSRRHMKVLYVMTKMNLSIPNMVSDHFRDVSVLEVEKVLDHIRRTIDITRAS